MPVRRDRRRRPGRAVSSTWPGCRRPAVPAPPSSPWSPGRPHRRSRWRPERPHRPARGPAGAGAGSPPARGLGDQPLQSRGHLGLVCAADHGRSTQRRLPPTRRGGRLSCDRRARKRSAGILRAVPAGHILLEHGVEIGAAEPEGAHSRTAHTTLGCGPLAKFGVHPERDVVPVHVFVGLVEMQAGRQHLLVEAEHRLEQARGSGRALEVADVGLDRPQRDRAVRRTRLAEYIGQAGELGCIADAGGCAMCLDAGGQRRIDTGDMPGPLHGQPLPDRVGRRDPFAAAVAGAGEAEQHRVDPVTGALGVG